MPKKRKTKVLAVARPKATTTNAQTMSELALKERADQLQVILSEFDIKVRETLKKMNRDSQTMQLYITRTFQDAIAKLPNHVQNMTMTEYAMSLNKQETTELASTASISSITSKKDRLANIKHTVWKAPEDLDIISEETSEEGDASKTVSRHKANAPSAKSTKGKYMKSTMQSPSRRTRSKLITPANRLIRGQWCPTPLYTPKFDPNLPVTPARLRGANDGEILVSAAGSPVEVRRRAFGTQREAVDRGIREMNMTPERVNKIFQLIAASLDQD